ncbi:MAG TPA: bifunctional demethylmenaquinone methyltransferase/2-methoxy-6-polyprenyl-1,4-benzoquinol methylase UbiE [Oscillatoriaceae cyanobacterium]
MTFQLPTREEKPDYVRSMFDRIAERYDLVNDAMTFGHHRRWKMDILRHVRPQKGDRCLDLATGTGDIARGLLRKVGPEGHVTALDFSPGMLEAARKRGPHEIDWVQGDMLQLPFPDASFDVVTVGFGLRNVADVPRALDEVARVLKPGGRFASLDLARVRLGLMKPFVNLYSFRIVPLIGKVLSGESEAYTYLPTSNEVFLSQDELAGQLRMRGFEPVKVQDLMGGTTAIVSGTRA